FISIWPRSPWGRLVDMAARAGPEGAVGIWFPHRMAGLAAADDGRLALELRNGVWRALDPARKVLLAERDLLRCEPLCTVDSGPVRPGVPPAGKLLILRGVALRAVFWKSESWRSQSRDAPSPAVPRRGGGNRGS